MRVHVSRLPSELPAAHAMEAPSQPKHSPKSHTGKRVLSSSHTSLYPRPPHDRRRHLPQVRHADKMSLVSRLRGAGDEQDAESQPAGQKSIAAMLAAPFSREESKKFFQELTQDGHWHQRYLCSLWFQRLQAFREQLLGKP